MNPFLLVKAFAAESLRAGLTIVIRPIVGAIFDLAARGDEQLYTGKGDDVQ